MYATVANNEQVVLSITFYLLNVVSTCTPAVARHEYVVHAARRVRGDVGRGGVTHLVGVRVWF